MTTITINLPDGEEAVKKAVLEAIHPILGSIPCAMTDNSYTFTLEKAKKLVPLGPNVTRGGTKGRVVFIDAGVEEPVLFLADSGSISWHRPCGQYYYGENSSSRDLVGHLAEPEPEKARYFRSTVNATEWWRVEQDRVHSAGFREADWRKSDHTRSNFIGDSKFDVVYEVDAIGNPL